MSERSWVNVFCPSHITGFFIPKTTKKGRGALGAGINLSTGVVIKAERNGTGIYLNGKRTEIPPVNSVLESLGVEAGIKVKSSVPLGCGYGVSGACALGTAVAINELFNMGLSLDKLVEIAHTSEITNKTGLGDVSAQKAGGLVIRKSLKPSGVAVIEKFLLNNAIDTVVFGELSTEDVISDQGLVRRIQKVGMEKLKEFLKNPTLHHFFRVSKEFSIETGLADDRIADILEAIEAHGGMASMAMLGRTVFAINGREILEEYGQVITAQIDGCGVRII